MDRTHLAEHLRFYQELGVTGINTDRRWRQREESEESGARELVSSGARELVSSGARESDDSEPSNPRAPEPPSPRAPDHPSSRAPDPLTFSRSSEDALRAIREEIGDCTRCKLHKQGRTQVVFGVGNPSADLMFVGEAPGGDEDIQGIPFVGRAGQLLTKIIEAIDLSRDQVYIANVIKCRPPGNRNPDPDEVETCEPFLFQQIDSIKPKVIVALGTFAAKALLKTQDPISRLRGRVYDYRGAKLVPTFHPAFLLRSPDRKRDVWEDMKKVRALLKDSGEAEG